ncbi:DUF5602 domain-containing protein [Synechococcus sp. A15-24]|jgi:hypothetical protein|uniref:DUF5602 domain-containing protein n=1 Tax=Synechococcus sp. A15-24 TaxID=1050635 RepID=UPI001645C796|nr:DUF5602 domain-containing protein [Synechococcus sp. A15-24]QNJ29821.1 hypothetical protein SynA1524_02134 [Synechococcus sp. A15-24]
MISQLRKLSNQISAFVLSLVLFCFSFPPNVHAATSTRVVQGDKMNMGKGEVWTWTEVEKGTGTPRRLGITLTKSALDGLPADDEKPEKGTLKLKLIDGSPWHNFEYEMLFPKEADRTAYNHMGLNWNPEGHGPLEDVFFEPHLDVHFYMATTDYRHSITNDSMVDPDTEDLLVQNIEPPRDFLPEGYYRAPNTSEPRMGTHYADMSSDQLKPHNFSNIFLFGGHNGNIVFWEPMLTRKYLLSKPDFSAKIPQPKAYPVSGYYPLSYSVKYDTKRDLINVSLDELTLRAASYPGNVYGVDSCLDSKMVDIIFTHKEAKPKDLQIPAKCQPLVPMIKRALS